jgi:hypothetical protein
MSRNSSGTATPPAGQPPSAGAVISLADHNALVSDIYAELTDSLSRSGKGTLTAVLKAIDGALSAPGYTFGGEPTSGLSRGGAGDLRLSILGALVLKLTAAGIEVTGDLTVSDDATVTGDLTVTGATALGSAAVENATVETLGVTGAATLSAGATVPAGAVTLSEAATQSIVKTGGTLKIDGSGQTEIWSNGTLRFFANSTGVSLNGTALNGLVSPTLATDAATKGYVDTQDAYNRPSFVVRVDGTNGSVLRVVLGSITGYVFARPAAGTYTITKAAGYSPNRIVQVTATGAPVAAGWTDTSGTEITVKTAGDVDRDLSITLYD